MPMSALDHVLGPYETLHHVGPLEPWVAVPTPYHQGMLGHLDLSGALYLPNILPCVLCHSGTPT